jgi:uncharacterized protein
MNAGTQRGVVAGPAGALAIAVDTPAGASRGLALVCHPHPLHGGTLDNKVVQTLARAFVALGYTCVRFNFRGVGGSEGQWDEGRGEIDDALAVLQAQRAPGQALVLGGFSFGAYVASQVAAQLADGRAPGGAAERLVLVGPAASRFDVAAVPADTLVVHGEVDDVVPLSAALDWARPQSLPVVVVPGAGHFFHGQLPLLKTLVTRAFAPGTAT